jgi:hypothetical protein
MVDTVERLLELMGLLRDINKVLYEVMRLVWSYGVDVYLIGGKVKLADNLECYMDVCLLKTQDYLIRVHEDGSIDKMPLLGLDIVKASRDEVEGALAHYEERVNTTIKSLRELREILAIVATTIKLAS